MTSSQRSTRDLAAALRKHAAHSAATTGPLSRASTMQRATVATVATDQTTITTTDGIPAIRLASYTDPAPGDTIQIATTATGAWVALGRLAASADADSGWQTLSLASGYVPYTTVTGYPVPQYRTDGRRVWMRGAVQKSSGSFTRATVFATLPAAACPQSIVSLAGVTNDGSTSQAGTVRLEVTAAGGLRVLFTTISFTLVAIPDNTMFWLN